MPGGAYAALSGMQTRLNELDRIATDLANIYTAGYKTERMTTFASERDFTVALQSAVDAAAGASKTDLRPGTITGTGRNLDVAIDGEGFFAIETPLGVRYTRSGNFTRSADGSLTTVDGERVLDVEGKPIKIGRGALTIEPDGAVRVDESVAGRIAVWTLAPQDLVRESGSRFRAVPGAKTERSQAVLVPAALEQANVSMIGRMSSMIEVSRSFEALQKGISVLMNDIDARAIVELGRRS
jgi:flagellar basal-body rod protein FlgF